MNLNCLLIFSMHINGPTIIENQILWSAYMFIYCHAVNYEFTLWV